MSMLSKNNQLKETTNSLKSRHLFKFLAHTCGTMLLVLLSTSNSFSGPNKSRKLSLKHLNPHYRLQVRVPSNIMENQELDVEPERTRKWYENILVEDSSGVLHSIGVQLKNWEKDEKYLEEWNMTSTGIIDTPSEQEKKNFFNRQMLKYLDKRLSGEIKNAEEGSTLHTVGKVQKALRPQTKVALTRTVKLRFKARVLQGKAIVKVENPYVDYQTKFSANGNVDMEVRKEIKPLKINAEANYRVNEDKWVARVDRKLSETINARVSSFQSTKDVDEDSDTVFELLYSLPF
jgi:hypothetical protein